MTDLGFDMFLLQSIFFYNGEKVVVEVSNLTTAGVIVENAEVICVSLKFVL